MRNFTIRSASLLLLSFSLILISIVPASAATNILFIVDASGSMKKKIGGKTRMSVAKDLLGKTLGEMPSKANLGLLLYGHRRAKDCKDIELVAPIGSEDATVLGKTISGLKAKGETPIAAALTKAAKSFKVFKGQDNQIILVTDGLEECKGDPCAAAKSLKASGLDVSVNIVGFTLGKKAAQKLQCVTKITGGKYYSASNAAGLASALQDVKKGVEKTAIVQTAKPQEFNGDVLADENGAKLEYAPSWKWLNLNKNHEAFVKKNRPTYGGEAVWSFKDGKSATFDRIEMLVPSQNKYNVKEFEVLAGEELKGPFRSVGKFKALNVKMRPAGWQGFKFPKTTAYYVKIVLKNSFGSYVGGNAIRIIGKIDKDSEAKSSAKKDEGVDVFAQNNGAKLEYAPNTKWAGINQESPEKFASKRRPTYGGEGVWSFKDGKSVTINKAKVMVNGRDKYNLRTFEVFTSDELAGPYKSLGKFTTFNARVLPDGWQHFPLPKTTAHFVKLKLINSYGSYVGGNAIQLIGKLNKDSEAKSSAKKDDGIDVFAQNNGAKLVYAPNWKWRGINQESPEKFASKRRPTYGGEGVWSFKDGKSVTINKAKVMVNGRDKYNLRTFEILTADELAGPYKSLGKFTTFNARVLPDGWQHFSLPETTAHFVKLKLLNSYGSYVGGNAIQLIGKLNKDSKAIISRKRPEGVDVFAPTNGGDLLFSPNDEWVKVNLGNRKRAVVRVGEGVWAFKDEKSAKLKAVQIYIGGAEKYNIKDFEILVGDEGPTGKFRSVGKFRTQNAVTLPDGWQSFTLPETTAKYLKLKTISAHGGSYIAMYGMKVIGELQK
ncbi:MAG: VWA domain-containing protein [Alphaproteobacteria bacterium]|nr:VWA domain-containing protein [Alphaproteobacteria bacterium]